MDGTPRNIVTEDLHDNHDHEQTDAASLLAKLKAQAASKTLGERPARLALGRIKRAAQLFQPRGGEEDDRHVNELVRAIKTVHELDPLLVMQIGRDTYLLDGHHRWAAYELAGVRTPVPVQYFEGTVEQAVLEAGRANTKAKLPMVAQERYDFAWRLVLLQAYSKKEIVEAAAVSDGQVANMRRVYKELGERAEGCRTWRKAHQMARSIAELTDEERDLWKERMAQQFADKISSACGPNFRNNTEIAAMAIERYFGRRLPGLVHDLRAFLPDAFDEDAEF